MANRVPASLNESDFFGWLIKFRTRRRNSLRCVQNLKQQKRTFSQGKSFEQLLTKSLYSRAMLLFSPFIPQINYFPIKCISFYPYVMQLLSANHPKVSPNFISSFIKMAPCTTSIEWLVVNYFLVFNRGDTVSRRSPIEGVRPSPYTTLGF